MEEKLQAKILFLGDHSTGKSILLNNLIQTNLTTSSDPAENIEFSSPEFESFQTEVILKPWEYPTNEISRQDEEYSFRGSLFCIIVVDIRSQETVDSALDHWIGKKESLCDEAFTFIIGTHLDQSIYRQVDINTLCKQCSERDAIYLEVSNVDLTNIILFRRLLAQRLEYMMGVRESIKHTFDSGDSPLNRSSAQSRAKDLMNLEASVESEDLGLDEDSSETLEFLLEPSLLCSSVGSILSSYLGSDVWPGYVDQSAHIEQLGAQLTSLIERFEEHKHPPSSPITTHSRDSEKSGSESIFSLLSLPHSTQTDSPTSDSIAMTPLLSTEDSTSAEELAIQLGLDVPSARDFYHPSRSKYPGTEELREIFAIMGYAVSPQTLTSLSTGTGTFPSSSVPPPLASHPPQSWLQTRPTRSSQRIPPPSEDPSLRPTRETHESLLPPPSSLPPRPPPNTSSVLPTSQHNYPSSQHTSAPSPSPSSSSQHPAPASSSEVLKMRVKLPSGDSATLRLQLRRENHRLLAPDLQSQIDRFLSQHSSLLSGGDLNARNKLLSIAKKAILDKEKLVPSQPPHLTSSSSSSSFSSSSHTRPATNQHQSSSLPLPPPQQASSLSMSSELMDKDKDKDKGLASSLNALRGQVPVFTAGNKGDRPSQFLSQHPTNPSGNRHKIESNLPAPAPVPVPSQRPSNPPIFATKKCKLRVQLPTSTGNPQPGSVLIFVKEGEELTSVAERAKLENNLSTDQSRAILSQLRKIMQ